MKTVIFRVEFSRDNKTIRQDGFTLFELLVVMAIVTLAIGTMISLYKPGKSSTDIKAVAYVIAAKINRTRDKAIRKQEEILILFDVSEKKITFLGPDNEIRLAENIDISVTSASSERRSQAVTGIRYFPNGRTTGGTVVLKQDKHVYEIRINWLTGRITTHKVTVQEK